jgi:hypothetical protein
MTRRRVVIRTGAVRSLSGVELFEALARAGLRRSELEPALEAIRDADGDPALALRGMRFLQAMALALELRADPVPAPTWAEAQRWDIEADATEQGEDLEADRSEYRVAASIATGLPPDQAEQLSVDEVERFARIRAGG